MTATSDPLEPPPSVALLQMMTGYWVSQSLYVAAKLGLPDLLADGPMPSNDLAAATQTHAPSLYRLLRALASLGVFTEVAPATFALSPLADPLRSDHPASMRALAVMYNEEQYRAWGSLLESVRTGESVFEEVFATPYFSYLAQHPEANETFNQAMTGWSAQLDRALLAAYDFSRFATVVDVGGGYGRLLATILAAHPALHGVLFDQPHVVADAGPLLEATGVANRCRSVGGDFFHEVPAGGDVYVLAQIVHDWDDERSVAILQACRRAIPSTGTLLLAELVIAPGDAPDVGKLLDLHMLVLLGGRERTETEYRSLLAASGFTLTAVIPTVAGTSLVEASPI